MAVTIMEALQNANYNIKNSSAFPPIMEMAKQQLNNGVELLEKGYSLEDEVEPLLEKYGSVENVPDKE